MTQLRIVHYNHTGVVAGAERVLLNALPKLRAEGVHSIVLSPPGPLAEEVARLGIATEACYPLEARFTWNPVRLARYLHSFITAIRSLRRQFQSLRPDAIHANSVRAGLVASSASIRLHLPVVWHVHDSLPRHPLSPVIRCFAALSNQTSQIAVSHSTSRVFCGAVWRKRLTAKTEVLHNAFSACAIRFTEPQRRRLRGELGAQEKFLIGCIGQICERKNQVAMVEIFAEVLKSSPEAMLVIVGSALFSSNVPYEERLKRRIKDLEIGRSVLLLGKRTDVPLLLETIDLLVLPSQSEPFAMILLEAMSAGVATVAYAVDGVPELLEDRRTAWLVRPGDAVQMARTILWAKNHPEQRRRLASAAQSELSKRDTPEVYGRRLAGMLSKRVRPLVSDAPATMSEARTDGLGETA
jgi:glycosyltransferase involved in cell wall biosynthesis